MGRPGSSKDEQPEREATQGQQGNPMRARASQDTNALLATEHANETDPPPPYSEFDGVAGDAPRESPPERDASDVLALAERFPPGTAAKFSNKDLKLALSTFAGADPGPSATMAAFELLARLPGLRTSLDKVAVIAAFTDAVLFPMITDDEPLAVRLRNARIRSGLMDAPPRKGFRRPTAVTSDAWPDEESAADPAKPPSLMALHVLRCWRRVWGSGPFADSLCRDAAAGFDGFTKALEQICYQTRDKKPAYIERDYHDALKMMEDLV
ncbi:hypothetical protein DFJ74DRAFT_74221 [Hyaloraphidium curvatum]|nr:hypothetical protein DFJ74DRAFT_74221 [Hyaloraphidium curvatum]